MQEIISVDLKRDCPAIQIPSGEDVQLDVGISVDITQTLGGTYTVRAPGGLYRIDARDSDALGIEPDDGPTETEETGEPATEAQIWEALKGCFDPEIPVNIVDLGLVYDLVMNDLPNGEKRVQMKMTLTAAGCGMGPAIAEDARQKMLALPGVGDSSVEVVWDPPWHQSMISEEGKRVLGIV